MKWLVRWTRSKLALQKHSEADVQFAARRSDTSPMQMRRWRASVDRYSALTMRHQRLIAKFYGSPDDKFKRTLYFL